MLCHGVFPVALGAVSVLQLRRTVNARPTPAVQVGALLWVGLPYPDPMGAAYHRFSQTHKA